MNTEKKIAYTLYIKEDFAKAIFWHGYRYSVTEFLIDHMIPASEDSAIDDWQLNLTEPEMWELCELWHDENECFACGSPEMNSWFQNFVDTMV